MVDALTSVLIPDLGSLVLDYLSLVELAEIGLSRPDHVSKADRLAYRIYTRGKAKSYTEQYVLAAPDYLQYAILVHAEYPVEVMVDILKHLPQYILDWLARSPRLSWERNRCGEGLLKLGLKCQIDLVKTIVINPALVSSIDQPTLEYYLGNLLMSLPRYYEELAVWLIQQPFECNWLCHVLTLTLKYRSDHINRAIFEQIGISRPHFGGVSYDDPLMMALSYNPTFVPDVLKYNLFIPRDSKYLSPLGYSKLNMDQRQQVILIVGCRLEPRSPEEGLITRLCQCLALVYRAIF